MYELLHPCGFMLAIYSVSEGSYTIVYEGKMQFIERGYGVRCVADRGRQQWCNPYGPAGPARPRRRERIRLRLVLGAQLGGREGGVDALHADLRRVRRHDAAHLELFWSGLPQGHLGPYHICIRAMPLPLPFG